MPAGPLVVKPIQDASFNRLATKSGEKCGLARPLFNIDTEMNTEPDAAEKNNSPAHVDPIITPAMSTPAEPDHTGHSSRILPLL